MVELNKKTVLWALTVLIIGAFILEFFVVIMWTPQEVPEATPTPAPTQLSGTGYGQATVTGFDDDAVIECNSTQPGAADAVTKTAGVSNAFFAADGVIALKLNKSFSTREFAQVAAGINSTLSQWCVPHIMRGAFIRLEAPMAIFGKAGNATLQPRDLENYAYLVGEQAPKAFVLPGTAENDSIQIMAGVALQGGQLGSFFAQQVSLAIGIQDGEAAENQSAAGPANASGPVGANASQAENNSLQGNISTG